MNKLRIGINTLPLFDTMAGAERYTQNIIRALARIDKNNEYILFLNPYNQNHYKINQDNFRNIICRFPKNKIARILYEQFILPLKASSYGIDILFSTCNIAPVRAKCRLVTMMFDLHWLVFPHFFDGVKNFYLKKMLACTAKRSDKILTLSTSSKNDIMKIFDIPPEKIKVTYCGYMGDDTNSRGCPQSPDIKCQAPQNPPGSGTTKFASQILCVPDPTHRRVLRSQAPLGTAPTEKYILSVSQFHKRKNIPTLIKAFEIVKEKLNLPHKLYLVGRPGDGGKQVLELCRKSKYSGEIKIIGYILDKDLILLYNNADIFVYPSFYEGFGMPVIEAMAHNIPVISSDASSLPEAAGDGALYFNPGDAGELAEKIEILIKDTAKREELIKKGREQIKKFSWEETARKTLDVFEEVGGLQNKGIRR